MYVSLCRNESEAATRLICPWCFMLLLRNLQEALPETMLKMDLNHHDVFPLVCRKSDARFLETGVRFILILTHCSPQFPQVRI